MKNMIKISVVIGLALVILNTGMAKDPVFIDDFKTDKLNEKWEWVCPSEGPSYKIDAKKGILIFTVPSEQTYDHWSHIAAAPQLALKVPKGNWTFEAKMKLAESTEGQQFHAVLFVRFADLDYFYWGPYMGTKLRLERSGANDMLNADYDSDEVWLQIKKDGSSYSWSYRKTEKDKWEEVGTAAEELEPEKIGFMIKTWGAAEVTAEFSSVRLY
ncbi:hypothetical protein COY52_01355 [Candidatus Desantisbacteria bacterium CG_4_10_14_0_8_um_filter_48_22]|uniref:DUF1349 domain-containing protein n=1 Tax=Candidatus Desantisbacteria bacterium CG_4_10_14_0_8_um_filter_48_22 TaxID=1974543 RepID=A0A2M7SF17_9BACT|nr:MAG: hypothetical protein AUJ67_04410 [Candidatus Desantisbacteria bacterium CG1_02_49_89]PIV56465.1 MAG: hypothetical protein COS16_03855 [Candidatus Desantisbacteria bacterium CG02_land_8_20_14_3_00_49_13]PIZ18070.1 MAG: hypothetical protein COY52_01355 [Candidatus Desantisbacteria bacterium CG_4_10_14_0_8_um_filter_48_22]PJB28322.1 MAG: hypothetical protein CO111_01905 [Candidatus Desantisbacteria bacterium CG_4_9_14_3_um_filter_50_7]